MAKRPSWVLKKGTPVSWKYRVTRGWGYVDGVKKMGKDEAHTEYDLLQVDDHVSSSGHHEKKIVSHFGSDIRRESKAAVKKHAKKARKRNAKKALDDRLAAVSDALDRLGV